MTRAHLDDLSALVMLLGLAAAALVGFVAAVEAVVLPRMGAGR